MSAVFVFFHFLVIKPWIQIMLDSEPDSMNTDTTLVETEEKKGSSGYCWSGVIMKRSTGS